MSGSPQVQLAGPMVVPGPFAYIVPPNIPSPATMFPQAFQTMTLQDFTWNMDTGASSHLADNSTDDLYPVTQPLKTHPPFALLSFNPTTWHRRLGHPSEDELRRLDYPLGFVDITNSE
ncbi:hypothetical protein Tco_1373553 [Tanacetum coccineum]